MYTISIGTVSEVRWSRWWRVKHIKGVSNAPSLVMKDMNSLTHSCMHSFASFAILAFSGRAVFMIRATGAKFRMSASDAGPCDGVLVAEGGERDVGELSVMIDAEWS